MNENRRISVRFLAFIGILVFILLSGMIIRDNYLFEGFDLLLVGFFVCIWGSMALRRLMNRELRLLFIGLVGCMLLLLCIQIFKYDVAKEGSGIQRFLWYTYYIPMLMAALISFYISLHVGRIKNEVAVGRYKLLLIPSGLICAVILLNDHHRLAFKFKKDFENWNNDYTHGPVYYIYVIFAVGLILASLFVLYKRGAGFGNKKRIILPLLPVVFGCIVLLFIVAGMQPEIKNKTVVNFPEVCIFMLTGMWEFAIETGLLPSNSKYREILENSGMQGYFLNKDGKPAGIGKAPENTDADHVLRSFKISGGSFCWLEDMTGINRLTEELTEARERLLEEKSLLDAEKKLKEEESRLETREKLHASTLGLLSPKIQAAEELIGDVEAPDYDERLKMACVLTAYIKRRCNLELMEQECPGAESSTDELVLCISESVKSAAYLIEDLSFSYEGSAELSTDEVKTCYEWFENQLEGMTGKTGRLDVRLSVNDRKINIKMDGGEIQSKGKKGFCYAERSFIRRARTGGES